MYGQIRSSFSQHEVFEKCPKTWYYSYIKKVPVSQDMSYANAGTVIHNVLEKWYNGKLTNIENAKEHFKKKWMDYNLHTGILKNKEDEYWLMCVNGINTNLNVKNTELKISFPEVTAYIDVVTKDNELIDWKSSTRSPENEESYKKQLQLYAYLYKQQYGIIPSKCTVKYLKYNGSKQELSFSFKQKDIMEIEEWYWNILEEMGKILMGDKKVPDWNYNYHWCPYKHLWQKEDKYHFILEINKNYINIKGPITNLLEKGLIKKFTYELKAAVFIKKNNPYARTSITFYNPRTKAVPVSMKEELIKTLVDYAKFNKKDINIDEVDNRVFNQDKVKMPKKFINNIKLRPHQKEAVDKFLEKKIAILQLATGAGKTEIAIELIRKLGMKTLFIVDKVDLMNQTIERIEKSLGIKCGKVGQGKTEIEDVTVATIQTLIKQIKEPQLLLYLRSLRFVIFDECHKVASKSYLKLSYQLGCTEYRLGLCLHMNTNILDEKGHIRRIKDIQVGDNVLSYNHKTKTIEPKKIINKFIKEKEEYLEITVKTKKGLRKIKCSNEHKFFTNNKYIPAHNLRKGNKLSILYAAHSIFDNNSKKEEAIRKIKEKLTGRKFSLKHCQKLSESLKGNIPWNKGKSGLQKSKRKGISNIDSYGKVKANLIKIKSSKAAKEDWKKNKEKYIFNRNKILERKGVRMPWYIYNRRIKIKQQTNSEGHIVCEGCSKIIDINNTKEFHCHHKDKNTKNNKLSNLKILCAKCHKHEDGYKKDQGGRFVCSKK